MASSYNSATLIGTGTNATNQARNKGVMIATAASASVTSIFFTTPGGTQGPEVQLRTVEGSVTIIPIRFYKTGGTQTDCTVYELT